MIQLPIAKENKPSSLSVTMMRVKKLEILTKNWANTTSRNPIQILHRFPPSTTEATRMNQATKNQDSNFIERNEKWGKSGSSGRRRCGSPWIRQQGSSVRSNTNPAPSPHLVANSLREKRLRKRLM
jgi:hypothetical protein